MKLHCKMQACHFVNSIVPEGIVITNYTCELNDEAASQLALLKPDMFSLKAFTTREKIASVYSATPVAPAPEEPTEGGNES
jgi:hypothetical protein